MAPDCDRPKCHENMMVELNKRPKWEDMERYCLEKLPTWLWTLLIAAALSLIGNGVLLWKDSASYATKKELYSCANTLQQDVERNKLNYSYLEKGINRIETTLDGMNKYLRKNMGDNP